MRTGIYLVVLLAALFAGLILLPRFWQSPVAVDTASTSSDLLRNDQRLERLRNRQLEKNVAALGLEEGAKTSLRPELLGVLDLLELGHVDQALRTFSENLDVLSGETDISRLLVEILMDQKRYEEALNLLYEQRLFVSEQDEARLMQLVFAAVERAERELESAERTDQLVSLFRLLINLHADHIPYHLRLAYWLIESGERDAAARVLAGASNDTRYSEERERLEFLLDKEPGFEFQDQVIVPLRKVGEHFIADVMVDDSFTAAMMIDTGATLTVVRESMIAAFGEARYSPVPLRMNTANGVVTGSRLLIPKLTLGNADFRDVEMGAIPLPDFQFDGLLGMNVLGRYRFRIDHDDELLYLGTAETDR